MSEFYIKAYEDRITDKYDQIMVLNAEIELMKEFIEILAELKDGNVQNK